MSTIGLGVVILVAARTGSYGFAGAVSAAYMLASALSAPVMGRLIDRFGQRHLLLIGFLGFDIGLLGLVVAVELDWPVPFPHLFAALAGLLYPPAGACVRARWTGVLRGKENLHTAFSFEAVVDEFVFMSGPVLVTVLATQIHELAGILVVLALSSAGGWWLAGLRATEPPTRTNTSAGDSRQSIGWVWITQMVVVAACLGSLFGATEVITVAFAQEQGHPGVTGLLLAIWALGSLIAGLVTGAVTQQASPLRRYRIGSLFLAVAMVPLPFVDNLVMLAVALFVAGFAISPTLVATMTLVETTVPAARLTEGITWISTGIGLGIAPGAAIAGALIDEFGASPAYYVPVASGLLAACVAWSTAPRSIRTGPVLEDA